MECHHERWDGKGYPHGLAGEDIPLTARVLCIADVYDALTSKRSYKQAFSHDEAMEIMRVTSGRVRSEASSPISRPSSSSGSAQQRRHDRGSIEPAEDDQAERVPSDSTTCCEKELAPLDMAYVRQPRSRAKVRCQSQSQPNQLHPTSLHFT